MKKYRSVGVIDFSSFGIERESVRKDQVFEIEEDKAAPILAAGLAAEFVEIPPEAAPPESSKKTVKVRLLKDCSHGACNDVVSMPSGDAKQAVKDGFADDAPSAIKYAESLKKE